MTFHDSYWHVEIRMGSSRERGRRTPFGWGLVIGVPGQRSNKLWSFGTRRREEKVRLIESFAAEFG